MPKKKFVGIVIALLFLLINFSPQMQALRTLPDEMIIQDGESFDASLLDLPLMFSASVEDSVVSSSFDESLGSKERERVNISLLGIPVKTVSLIPASQRTLIAGGKSIGVALYTKGALVVGTSDIIDAKGNSCNPALEAGLLPGDVIEQANGIEIENAAHLTEIINETKDKAFNLLIQRNGESLSIRITPIKDSQDNKYKLGMWVRDSTAGVGTLTYYDPLSKTFASLGHPITDVDTQEILSVKEGEILESRILDIRQGEAGSPGELKGMFNASQTRLGRIEANNEFGIYGTAYKAIENEVYTSPIGIGTQKEVVVGKATLLTTIDSNGVQEFECEIVRTNRQNIPSSKGMVIKITDSRLLETTGGIVQGMSGSPLIQGGKIIGAVTHVFINDPTQGYGMYIEWMLQQSDNLK
jgi:stage IV sporulation protein B